MEESPPRHGWGDQRKRQGTKVRCSQRLQAAMGFWTCFALWTTLPCNRIVRLETTNWPRDSLLSQSPTGAWQESDKEPRNWGKARNPTEEAKQEVDNKIRQ